MKVKATKYPKISEFPHLSVFLLDGEIAPTVSLRSRKEIKWECSKGHRWDQSPLKAIKRKPNGEFQVECIYCFNRKTLVGFNSLADTHPSSFNLLSNASDAYKTRLQEGKLLEWKCNNGKPHSFLATAHSRLIRGYNCAVCHGKQVVIGSNNLGFTHPELIDLLEDKNNSLILTAGSNVKVNWVCPVEGHGMWEANPYDVIRGNRKCDVCLNKKIVSGINDFFSINPNLIGELLNPEDRELVVKPNSNQKVMWQCAVDSRHIWLGSFKSRNRGFGCLICAGKLIIPGLNDLLTLDPEVANLLKHRELGKKFTKHSNKKLEWQCPDFKHHEWVLSIQNQVARRNCPHCNKYYSKAELELFETLQNYIPDLKHDFRPGVKWGSTKAKPKEAKCDMGSISHKMIVEYDGYWFHKDSVDRDTIKTDALIKNGWTVVRIRENNKENRLDFLEERKGLIQISRNYKDTIEQVVFILLNKIEHVQTGDSTHWMAKEVVVNGLA